ncbi:hypothetical protein RO3G_16213 [Rhizopus delemar RA 99-880]|uniref:Uncharacterized protein n=1 Tax=Rhizopus delemar (strain RA 99-880 / ATCC MYA-4621 / FGSC 9543 / NRRL 43880) TaxID=246409 RepID=I1CSS2_RHIO9|nr:hypothetical protein RO3G_16213 [Rhizopus delemar RA 99-880]|eukprot:EIE91502.1 hypothetical protein RO3G_16213 [Rhizopus delemar RA 99-880]
MAPPASTSLQERLLALVKVTYFGAMLSYGVVLYKSHGIPQASSAYMRKLVMDENAQYFLLAVYWFISNPIAVTLLSLVTLIPFFTFSTFHALGYVRTNIIPNIFPAATSNNGTTVTWQAKTQQKIKAWTDKYYSVAMRFVAHSEVTVIAVRLLLGVFRLQLVPIFLFAQFLRFRYHLSSYTRQTFTELRVRFDSLLLPPTADPRIPPVISNAYNVAKIWVSKFGEAGVQRQPAAAQ